MISEIKDSFLKTFRVGIIGCGLIGQKRANSLGVKGHLLACADIDLSKAKKIADLYKAKAFKDWRDLLALPDIDIVVIATLHDSLAEITLEALKAGKHVLVEKPAARYPEELDPIMDKIKETGLKVHVGFNHRYHRALRKAKELVNSEALGELMFIRARYGHGARIGYDKEWRSDPVKSGGGELIDQGPHLIDLSRWFLGDFVEVSGYAHTYYWDMPVDDNGFMLLKTSSNQVAFLHASCTEWKNLFSMEIYGKKGKIDISGLGGSYGTEKITFYKMLPEMGPPETTSWEYPMGDDSWAEEFQEFCDDISLNRECSAGVVDAYEALKVVQKIYKESGYDYCS
jgi:predicted dehydrogenase